MILMGRVREVREILRARQGRWMRIVMSYLERGQRIQKGKGKASCVPKEHGPFDEASSHAPIAPMEVGQYNNPPLPIASSFSRGLSSSSHLPLPFPPPTPRPRFPSDRTTPPLVPLIHTTVSATPCEKNAHARSQHVCSIQ